MNKMVDDTACIAEWRKLLKVFHLTIENYPDPESIKQELIDIKEAAKVAKNLTFHQVSAIVARCDNYMNGEYGNTKRSENINMPVQATVGKDQQNGK